MSEIENVEPEDVRNGLRDAKLLLIDVREPREFAVERIHGALNFPLSTFDASALPADGPRRVILHCGSGKRSGDALARCAQAGVAVSAHMQGGLKAWKRDQLPVVNIDPATGKVRDAS